MADARDRTYVVRRKTRFAVTLVCLLLASVCVGCSSQRDGGLDETAWQGDSSAMTTAAAAPGVGGVDGPLAVGVEMTSTVDAPAETIAMIDESQASPGAMYEVMFQPYGYGPKMPRNQSTLIIIVRASRTEDESESKFDPTGKNLMVVVDDRNAGLVCEGGVYSGSLELIADAGTLSFRMDDVRDISASVPTE